jgi:uncharacterized protein YkwD
VLLLHDPMTSTRAAAQTSRRHLLGRFGALLALLLAGMARPPGASGQDAPSAQRAPRRERKRGQRDTSRNKKKRKGKRKGKKGKGKGGGGGGGYSPDSEERAFLKLINDYRKRHNASPLSLENHLGAAAEHHSRDMARKNYFKHKLANGDSAEKNIERHGYTNWKQVGENIAAGQESAKEVMAAWEKSAGHARNMRDPGFTEIGIGRAYAKSSKYGWYWTTTFGDR